jgi:AhpD family alkylhydroperoxidase
VLTGTPTRAPALLGQALGLLPKLVDIAAIWGEQRVDPKLREQVMLAVAQANACRLCTMAHRRWALAEGVTDAELAALEQHDQARFDRRTWAAVAWADARARADLGPVADEFERELARYYSRAERDDLDVVTRVMTIANRSANAFDALRERLRGRPGPGSRLPDELIIGTFVAASIPPVAGYLALTRRRRRP